MIKHGGTGTKLYFVWKHMKERCYQPSNPRYSRYGGRGIRVCPQWEHDFAAFREWAYEAGYREGLTLDRIDNNAGYSPENCRWATYETQNNNFSRNRKVEFRGETHSVSEWSRILGIHRNTLDARLSNEGWTVEEAFFTKPSVANKSPQTRSQNFTYEFDKKEEAI